MRKKRRDVLRRAIEMIQASIRCKSVSMVERALEIVENALNEEEDSRDNYPENLQSTSVYGKMEDACDFLTDTVDDLNDMVELAVAESWVEAAERGSSAVNLIRAAIS